MEIILSKSTTLITYRKLGGNNLRNLGKKRSSRAKEILLTHLKNNIREYSIATLLFLIGLIFGIIFVNNALDSRFYR